MSDIRVALRYARAFYNEAIKTDTVNSLEAEVIFFLNTCDENRAFDVLLKSPVVAPLQKEKIIKRVFEGKLSKMMFDYIHLVVFKGRDIILEESFRQFLKMVDAAKGVIKAKVTTAIELPESSLTNIKNYLSKRVNAQIEMDVEINAELLGGFILKYDDKLIDASVSSQLKELRKSLLNSN